VIVCPRCSKENQDHYKFCLGCGSELPREAAAPRPFSPRTPPSAMPVAQGSAGPLLGSPEKALPFARTQQGSASNPPPRPAGVAVPPAAPLSEGRPPLTSGVAAEAAAVAASAQRAAPEHSHGASSTSPNNCPSCGNPVPIDFKFCGTCGHRMPGAAGQQPVAAAPAPAAVVKPSRGSLVVINPDGSEGGTFPLGDGSTSVGRSAGALFAADAYLSPQHATFVLSATNCTVRDDGSLNGIYVKLKRDAPIKLSDGDIFRIGQELIRFDSLAGPQFVDGVEPMGSPNPGYVGRLSLVIGRESTGNSYPIPPDGMHMGRERGDVIFPDDGYVSGLHCRVHYDGSSCVLTDVGSSNGTFLRVRGSRAVVSGDLLLMGQQLFRVQC